jgi:phosphoribosylaminoimidazolecarboxamide formyltransferase/IMP cyclohydrolase
MPHAQRLALLSVTDKSGIVELGRGLAKNDFELLSTGGTAKALRAAGIPVIEVATITGFPEIMDGRVKTLHPAIHGALLGIRDDPDHARAMHEHAIQPIDLLVVNLTASPTPPRSSSRRARRRGARAHAAGAWRTSLSEIDIGGPLIRIAAVQELARVTGRRPPTIRG